MAITVQELVGAFAEFERPMLRTRPGWKTQPEKSASADADRVRQIACKLIRHIICKVTRGLSLSELIGVELLSLFGVRLREHLRPLMEISLRLCGRNTLAPRQVILATLQARRACDLKHISRSRIFRHV